jgi:MerR family transcriptional regulator, copper efflux regulator
MRKATIAATFKPVWFARAGGLPPSSTGSLILLPLDSKSQREVFGSSAQAEICTDAIATGCMPSASQTGSLDSLELDACHRGKVKPGSETSGLDPPKAEGASLQGDQKPAEIGQADQVHHTTPSLAAPKHQNLPRNRHRKAVMKQHRTLAIGAAARAASISVKMVRHYETTGLLPAAQRGTGGTRLFNEQDVHTLRFIARARALGFPLRTVRELLSLWQHPARSNAETRQLAEQQLRDLLARRAALDGMSAALQRLIEACAGDGRPECPILDDLADASRPRSG